MTAIDTARVILATCFVFFGMGCQTYQPHTPNIKEPRRPVSSAEKIYVSFFDGRVNRDGGEKPLLALKDGILKAYSPQLIEKKYFSPTPRGQREVKVRLIESAAFRDGIPIPLSPDEPREFQSIRKLWFGGEWVGVHDIQIEYIDLKLEKQASFRIYSQRRAQARVAENSALFAGNLSWQGAGAELFYVLDGIIFNSNFP